MPVALVTGANKGVGFAVARLLGQRGVDVWIGARDSERGRAAVDAVAAEGIAATFVQLDVTEVDSIARAAARLEQEVGGLDILVNNAGMIVEFADAYPKASPPSQVPIERLRLQHATNVLGPMFARSPITMFPRIVAPQPTDTPHPSVGRSLASRSSDVPPMVTLCRIIHSSPMTARRRTTIPRWWPKRTRRPTRAVTGISIP